MPSLASTKTFCRRRPTCIDTEAALMAAAGSNTVPRRKPAGLYALTPDLDDTDLLLAKLEQIEAKENGTAQPPRPRRDELEQRRVVRDRVLAPFADI